MSQDNLKKNQKTFNQFSEKLATLNLKKKRNDIPNEEEAIDPQNELIDLLAQLKSQNTILKEASSPNINVNITNNSINYSIHPSPKVNKVIKEGSPIKEITPSITTNKNMLSFRNEDFVNQTDNLILIKEEKDNSLLQELERLKRENEEKERLIQLHQEKERERMKKIVEEEALIEKEKERLLNDLKEKERILQEQAERERIRELKEEEEKKKQEREEAERLMQLQIEKNRLLEEEKKRIEKEVREKIENELKEEKERIEKELQNKIIEENQKRIEPNNNEVIKKEKESESESENKELRIENEIITNDDKDQNSALKIKDNINEMDEENKEVQQDNMINDIKIINDDANVIQKTTQKKSQIMIIPNDKLNESMGKLSQDEENPLNAFQNEIEIEEINDDVESLQDSIKQIVHSESNRVNETDNNLKEETNKVINTFLSNLSSEEKSHANESNVNMIKQNSNIEKVKAQLEKEKEEQIKLLEAKKDPDSPKQNSIEKPNIQPLSPQNEKPEDIIKYLQNYKIQNKLAFIVENKSKYSQIVTFEQCEDAFLKNSKEPPSAYLIIRRRKAFIDQAYFSDYILKENNIVDQRKKMFQNYQDILEESLKQYEQEKPFNSIFNVVLGHDNNRKEEVGSLLLNPIKNDINMIGPIENIRNLIQYYSFTNENTGIVKGLMQHFTYWRQIETDGNSFYRVFMFSVFEYYIFTKNIHEIQKIILGIAKLSEENSVTSEHNVDFKKILAVFYFIYNELSKENYLNAYNLLLNAYKFEDSSFDTAMIMYCRYSIYYNVEELYNTFLRPSSSNMKDQLKTNTSNANAASNEVDKVDPSNIIKFGQEPSKIVFSAIPFVFNVNLEIIGVDGGLSKNGNNIKATYTKFTDHSFNDLPLLSVAYFLSSYYKIYKKNHQSNVVKAMDCALFSNVNDNQITKNILIEESNTESGICDKCHKQIKFVYLVKEFLCACYSCFLKDIETILKNRIINYTKEKYNNIEYYTRKIQIKEHCYLNDYDIIVLTGMNIANYLLKLSKTLCTQCSKVFEENFILVMKCQCQFCRDCLTSNLHAATNGEMLQNKFEKNYGEKYGCICKNVFDPEDAFKLLKIDPAPYRLNAQFRMNQYAGIFCIICGLQVLEGGDDMMVNTNRTTDNYYKFKIKKPDSYNKNKGQDNEGKQNKTNRTQSQQSSHRSNRTQNNAIYNEVSYFDHIMCSNCVEIELQKDTNGHEGNAKINEKVFLCKICDVDHIIEKNEWNNIFKKTCCSTCSIY